MPKMRIFKIDDGNEIKDVEATSFKKAVKSFQGSSEAKMVGWRSFCQRTKITIGQKEETWKIMKVNANPLVRLLVKLRMFYADVRGHHGKRWDYEPGDHYMGGKKRKQKIN